MRRKRRQGHGQDAHEDVLDQHSTRGIRRHEPLRLVADHRAKPRAVAQGRGRFDARLLPGLGSVSKVRVKAREAVYPQRNESFEAFCAMYACMCVCRHVYVHTDDGQLDNFLG